MRYDNEGYYSNNPYLRSDDIFSEEVTININNKRGINQGTKRKQVIEIEKTKDNKVSVTTVDENGDKFLN